VTRTKTMIAMPAKERCSSLLVTGSGGSMSWMKENVG
jgi:hypothetical protein